MTPADVKLTWANAEHTRLTDGAHTYWQEVQRPDRWRWAVCNWPDDGVGLPGHGTAPTLLHAVEAAHAVALVRREVTG